MGAAAVSSATSPPAEVTGLRSAPAYAAGRTNACAGIVRQTEQLTAGLGSKAFVTDTAGSSTPAAGPVEARSAAEHAEPARVPRDAQPPNDDADQSAQPADPRRYYRCGQCDYVVGPQAPQPGRCPNCQTVGGPFSPTEIVFPAAPGDEAIDRDTRDTEAAIRQAYARAARHPGESVPLAAIRAALPAHLDRETVDAALTKLAGHVDVHILPRTDQQQADPTTQQAAVRIGGDYSHRISIEEERPDLPETLKRIRSTSRVQAESMLAPLNDAEVWYLADRMGVDTAGSPADVRQRIAERAEANRQERLADGRQGEADGELLARADNDPEWVKGWTDADRQAASQAAARLLARAEHGPGREFIRDRATRWA